MPIQVYDTLHGSYQRLCAVFGSYCTSAGEAGDDAARMSRGEWLGFCREIKAFAKTFSQQRAEQIYTYSMSSSCRELLLPHFLEALVHLAFQRANPDLSRENLVARKIVPVPTPCSESAFFSGPFRPSSCPRAHLKAWDCSTIGHGQGFRPASSSLGVFFSGPCRPSSCPESVPEGVELLYRPHRSCSGLQIRFEPSPWCCSSST